MPRPNRYGIAGLYRDKDPAARWRFDHTWVDQSGVRRRYRERMPAGTTQPAAKERARQLVNLAIAGKLSEAGGTRRLKASLDEYLKWRKTEGRTGEKKSKAQVEALLAAVGDMPLEHLSPIALERFKKARRDDKAGPATINRALALFKHAAVTMARWGWISRAQAAELADVPRLKEPPGRVRWLSDDEEARLLEAVAQDQELAQLVAAALATGVRRGMLFELRVADVDLGAGVVTFRRMTKNNRTHTVPIAKALKPVLKARIEANRAGFVFERAGEQWTDGTFKHAWSAVRTAARLEDFKFHDCRHDFATKAIRNGAPLEVVSKLLGHSTMQMTLRYAHLAPGALRDAVEIVSAKRAAHAK